MTQDQRAKRLHHHLYESCEGIREQSERIVKLEELVQDMWFGNLYYTDGRCDWCRMGCDDDEPCSFWMRMRELGVEVDG